MRSDDPSRAEVLRRSLQGAPSMIEAELSNAVFLGGSRKPWLRQLEPCRKVSAPSPGSPSR
jgi:hypothetical protein